ncbi:amidase family protein [Arthrobacter sp. OV608]|uniref:amidase family protein n=1 Tax=Arthrobacter sp. OV608 TaxID=1882768 RepID=UPI0008AD8A89|nr:amidase family protein [Arthrobacter sp. OV608]SEQ79062.1 Amidase [Arthrobacter sp. OV608]
MAPDGVGPLASGRVSSYEDSRTGERSAGPGPRQETLGGYRIAVVFDDPYCPVDTTVVEVLTSLVAKLRSAGATIEETSPPAPLSETDPLYQQTVAGVTAAFEPPQAIDFYAGMVARAGLPLTRIH